MDLILVTHQEIMAHEENEDLARLCLAGRVGRLPAQESYGHSSRQPAGQRKAVQRCAAPALGLIDTALRQEQGQSVPVWQPGVPHSH